MFNFLKGKSKEIILDAPIKGNAVAISEVSDPTFGEEILGKGIAIKPIDGKVYAPADGKIEVLFETLHAVSMTSDKGVEILIHIGLDTVKLKGEGFTAHVKLGDNVKKGDLLITVDLDKVKEAGYDTITPMIVCNTENYANVDAVAGVEVNAGDPAIIITQK